MAAEIHERRRSLPALSALPGYSPRRDARQRNWFIVRLGIDVRIATARVFPVKPEMCVFVCLVEERKIWGDVAVEPDGVDLKIERCVAAVKERIATGRPILLTTEPVSRFEQRVRSDAPRLASTAA